jgi:hypothetical protein
MKDTLESSETSVYFNQTARHHFKGNNLYCHRHENFKFQISSLRQYDDDGDVHNDNDYRSNEEEKNKQVL